MLEKIRSHAQGWIAKIILGFIALTFAVWGVNWYFEGGGQSAPAITVNDESVSQQEFNDVLRQLREDTRAQDDAALRRQVTEQLVNTRLIISAARQAGMQVGEAQVSAFLANLDVFKENGQFSQQRLQAWLRNRGLTPAAFAQMAQQDLLLRQFQAAYGEGAVAAMASAGHLGRLLAQKRVVRERLYHIDHYINAVHIDDKAVAAEYEANRQAYKTPAQVRVRYLVLSPDVLAARVQIDDSAARQYYEANAARYQEPEQRRAAHILIRTEPGMDAQAKAQARAKAEQLLKEVRANPARFAELARQHSQDPVSAAQGGDLGAFTRDMMVKPFADAVFAMQPGEVRGPVETEFGYHIIRLDKVIPGSRLGFEVVKNDILQELRQQEAQRRFAEAADRFGNLVYEQPDSLEPAARELGLTEQESGWISRQQAEPRLLAHPRLIDALFSPDALQKRHNTEAVEVSPNVLVAARVIDYRPEGERPLQEVAAEIRLKLAARAARDQAVAAGHSALKAAQAGTEPTGLGAPMTVSRLQAMNLPVEAVRAIFRARADRLPTYVGVETREGYRLYRIEAVQQEDLGPEQVRLVRRDLQRMIAQEELRALLKDLRARAEIEVNQAVTERGPE
ncbi:MAG: SurA N-terminal domain-containing protein [Thiobacillaceae bacterium]|nr:SurA N-terminal domain-containing protein [Thiobacillaceae bacterium]